MPDRDGNSSSCPLGNGYSYANRQNAKSVMLTLALFAGLSQCGVSTWGISSLVNIHLRCLALEVFTKDTYSKCSYKGLCLLFQSVCF
jgi:hypothetical protein